MGDPAYDLAIVTRGARRPFQVTEGMERFLEAYVQAGGPEITVRDVRFYEVCMVASWYREALGSRHVHPPEEELNRLRGVLRRAVASRVL